MVRKKYVVLVYLRGSAWKDRWYFVRYLDRGPRRYRILYGKSQGIAHSTIKAHKGPVHTTARITLGEPVSSCEDYSLMTREELMEELMKTRSRESKFFYLPPGN